MTPTSTVTPPVLDALDTSIIDPTKFPDGVVKIITGTDGKVYTVPVNIHRANVIWFNKKVFADNNLTAPETLDEFFTAADTLKAKNITPLALGDKASGRSGMVFEDVLIGTLGAGRLQGPLDRRDRVGRCQGHRRAQHLQEDARATSTPTTPR